jgi:effector-binding domain-containing protein
MAGAIDFCALSALQIEMEKAIVSVTVSVETVPARLLAAVRRQVRIAEIANTWKPALDQVWAFLREHPGVRSDGHNVFLYHHPANRQSPMDIDFGVQVTRPFERAGEVYATETPAGKVATAVHLGPYQKLSETHDAIHAWAAANQVTFAGKSWEVYGDPTPDPAKTETRIEYLLS